MDDEARIPQPVMPDGKTRAQLWPVSLYGQQQFASAIRYDPQRDAAVERLSEENAELKGIIAGLNDVREGRVKPLAQIHEELRESHD
jgi:hypothetical protein